MLQISVFVSLDINSTVKLFSLLVLQLVFSLQSHYLVLYAIVKGLIFVSLCVYKLSLCILSIPAGYGLLAIIIVFIPSIADKINTFLLTIILPIIFTILIFDKEIEVIIIVSSISGSLWCFMILILLLILVYLRHYKLCMTIRAELSYLPK